MLIYEYAYDRAKWEQYFADYSANDHATNTDVKHLRNYIDSEKYEEVLQNYESSGNFPEPRLLVLNKKGTEKKRAVFSFDEDEAWLLKFFGFWLHTYDDIFSDNLYSFRKQRSVKTAVARILKQKKLSEMYGVKLDIHDYFNSADTDLILKKLQEILILPGTNYNCNSQSLPLEKSNDKQIKLYKLFENILRNPYVHNEIKQEKKSELILNYERIISPVHKGMMAGSPLSPFLANLYLNDLDRHFDSLDGFYARYSDDIVIFTENEDKLKEELNFFMDSIKENGLTLNPDKLSYISPGQSFEFLGFSFENGSVDVSKSSFEKIKKKLRRKARAILRWRVKKDIEAEKAARVYIRYFNRKFFENPVKSELTWCRWYFPIITTDVTLKEIDHYMQECIRYIFTGKHTKRNYNIRYETLKGLGYRSLVNEFHKNP